MDWMKLGHLQIATMVESEGPVFRAVKVFPQATKENLDPYLDWLVPRALCLQSGKLVMPVQSYLVRTRRSLVLIDACVGNDKSNDWYRPWHKQTSDVYLSQMQALGARPEDVDYVLCSHLHVDHCGWNTRLVDGRWVPTFPNARYIFARTEFEDSQEHGGDVFEESVRPIAEAKQAVLVDTDHQLDDNIWLEPTPGHTRGHVAIHLSSDGKSALMTGDLMHSPVQCAHPEWSPVFDADPGLAAKTRQAILDRYCNTDTLVMTAHFPTPSVGYVRPGKQAFFFEYL